MEDLPRSSANSFVPTFFPSTVNATVPSIFPSLPLCNAAKMVTVSPTTALSCESQMLRGGKPAGIVWAVNVAGRAVSAQKNKPAAATVGRAFPIPDTIYEIRYTICDELCQLFFEIHAGLSYAHQRELRRYLCREFVHCRARPAEA